MRQTCGPYQSNTVVVGDCGNHLHELPDESVTAVLCDPPYGLAFMGKEWDSFKNNAQYQAWVMEWAAELLRVCKPGAVGLFFGGTRTFHRLACGLEDAGWEVYDTLMWVYGSGFPKSHDISKAIDRAAGAERDVVGRYQHPDGNRRNSIAGNKVNCYNGARNCLFEHDITAPATPAAAEWSGWGTALKPAWEPIILARKPRRGTYAECAVEHGAGALWINGTRIYHSELEKHTKRVAQREGNALQFNTGKSKGWVEGTMASAHPTGRWPANVILSHHPDCVRVGTKKVKGSYLNHDIKGDHTQFSFRGKARTHNTGYTDLDGLETVEAWECVEGCPVKMLDEMSGERPVSGSARSGKPATRGNYDKPWHIFHMPHQGTLHNDSGGASRFFYTAKSSRRERNAGLPEGMQNNHCTVKSLSICEYLAKLIRPPEEYLDEAVILVPFCGTGSEIIGAIRAGWRNWLGIEISEEYAEIARARIAYWQGRVEDERAQLAMELG